MSVSPGLNAGIIPQGKWDNELDAMPPPVLAEGPPLSGSKRFKQIFLRSAVAPLPMWNPRWIHTGSDSTVTTPFPQTTRAPQRRLFLFSGLGLDLVSSPVVRTVGVSSLLQPNRGSVLTPQAWRCRLARPEPPDFGPDRADGGQTFMQVPRCKTEFTMYVYMYRCLHIQASASRPSCT